MNYFWQGLQFEVETGTWTPRRREFKKAWMYPCVVQNAEDARNIGIILFSYAAMDVGHFVKEVRQLLDAIR